MSVFLSLALSIPLSHPCPWIFLSFIFFYIYTAHIYWDETWVTFTSSHTPLKAPFYVGSHTYTQIYTYIPAPSIGYDFVMCPNTKSAYQRLLMDQIAYGIPHHHSFLARSLFPLSTYSTSLDPEKGFKTGRATPPLFSTNRNGNALVRAVGRTHHPPARLLARPRDDGKNNCCIVIYTGWFTKHARYPFFKFDNKFIRILIFRNFKYTLRPNFQILMIYYSIWEG